MVPYYEIVISKKKGCSTVICDKMDEPWKHQAKWKKLVTKKHIVRFNLYEMCTRGKSLEVTHRLGAA